MARLFLFALTAGLLITEAAAGHPASVGPPGGSASTAVAAAVTPRPVHAVLRYDAAATEACRSLSDRSSEMCLLLALHVIRMSEKPFPGGRL